MIFAQFFEAEEIKKLHQKMLDNLADNKNKDIRWEVAHNPSTSVDTLRKLSSDHYPFVRERVAHNQNTDLDTLKKLSRDEDLAVRWQVARNPTTDMETLERLTKDPDGLVSDIAHTVYKKRRNESK